MSCNRILWIYCDELRADALSCYGGPEGLTPHLDQLAAEGTRFTEAYCSSPVCVPSRTAAITGQLPTRTGIYHNEAAWPGFDWHHQPGSWLEDFQDAGWLTVSAGKSHLPHGYQPFQEFYPAGGGMNEITAAYSWEELKIIAPPGLPTMVGGAWPEGVDFPPEKVTQQCIKTLTEHADQTLFLRASYLQPHTPVTPPAELIEKFRHLEIPDHDLTSTGPSDFEKAFARNLGTARMSKQEAREAWLCYMALVHWVDLQVGELIQTLKDLGQYEATLICFTADHGAALGEDGLWAKQNFRRFNHQVPLIFKGPGIDAGAIDDQLSDSTDLGVTFKEAAGIETDRVLEGIDLFDSPSRHDHLFSILGYGETESKQFPNRRYGGLSEEQGWPRRACIRTKEWRYERNVVLNGRPVSSGSTDADACLIHAGGQKESKNRVREELAVVHELESILQEYLQEMKEPECALYSD